MKAFLLMLVLVASRCMAAESTRDMDRYLENRALTRITHEKIDVAESVRTLCWDPRLAHGPHLKPGLHIYVNDVVLNALEAHTVSLTFPVGSLIVKEKFEDKQDAEPSLITVMEKITDTGQVDDWRFMMIRIPDRSVVRDDFEVSCTDCHSRFHETGFVSRTTVSLLQATRGRAAENTKPVDSTTGDAPRNPGGSSED